MSPLRKLNIRFITRCAEAVLKLMLADAESQDFVRHKSRAGDFYRYGARVDIHAFAIDHPGFHILMRKLGARSVWKSTGRESQRSVGLPADLSLSTSQHCELSTLPAPM
jgi:hypothetical protein